MDHEPPFRSGRSSSGPKHSGRAESSRFRYRVAMNATDFANASLPPSTMEFSCPTRIVFGRGELHNLGALTKTLPGQTGGPLQCKRVLLVVDRGVQAAGHAAVATESLRASGIEVTTFSDFRENPTSTMIDRGVAAAADCQPDLLVGLGGGSSLDCAKAINFVFCCGGQIADYRGSGTATADLLPMIAVPTTAGTGSEVQSYAIISDDQTHVKMPCGDRRALPRIAILDPDLITTQPPIVAALTGIDAISHAVETCVTRRRTAASAMFSREAFRHLSGSFTAMIRDPTDLDHAAAMQWGAAMAGMAIESSMLGAAHATANPLTARYGIAHGQAVGLMLPAVVRLNADHDANCQSLYGQLVRTTDPSISDATAGNWLADRITRWLRTAGLQTGWSTIEPHVDIDACATDALAQWTGTFNPVPLTIENVSQLYQSTK